MNERTPPPKLENIAAAIKFDIKHTDHTDHGNQVGRAQLVASLHVGSSCWFVESEAQKHPDVMVMLKEKLKRHLLRQLYHEQYREIGDAVDEFMRGWTPGPFSCGGSPSDPFAVRDRLMKLAGYTPPPGFDDEFDCGDGPNCGCEQFEFLLQPSPRK